jgi:membrane protease YdiL (CAAX protease family)
VPVTGSWHTSAVNHSAVNVADLNQASQRVKPESRNDAIRILLVTACIEATLWTAGRTQFRCFLFATFVLIACALWDSPTRRELGVGLHGIAGASVVLPIAVLASVTTIFVAWHLGTLKILYGDKPVLWHSLLYLLWALQQQFILNSFFYRRFESLIGDPGGAMVVTAALFAFVHIPNPVLVPATFVGGLLFVAVFRRFPNIYPLAIAHAMMGLTLAITIPDPWLRHMRVGLGYFRFIGHR